MDEAIALIAAATAKPPRQSDALGDGAKPIQTDQANAPSVIAQTPRVIHAAEFSSKTYLETEADVDAYIAKLKDALLTAVRAGQIARIQ